MHNSDIWVVATAMDKTGLTSTERKKGEIWYNTVLLSLE